MPRVSDPLSDELAMAAGYALVAWTNVENTLSYLFESVSGMPHAEAHVAIATIVGFEARLDLCSNLLRRFLGGDDEYTEIWNRAHEKLSKQYKKRHEVAHFQFVISGLEGVRTVRLVPFWSFGHLHLGKNTDGLTVADIDARADIFKELAEMVWWFNTLVQHRKGKSGADLEPEPDLVRQFRITAAQSRADKQRRAPPSPQ